MRELETKGVTTPRGRARTAGHLVNETDRLKAVKLHIEDDIPVEIIAKQLNVHYGTIYDWCRKYRESGSSGLKSRRGKRAEGISAGSGGAINERIVALKKDNPEYGIKKISQFLRRMFFLPASPEKVRKTLHKEGLMKPMPKPKKNPQKPRFFERATPNQMWQSDIFSFKLLGANAYLIGFMDDYSRYLVGLGLYRSQTSEHVLETFRRAAAEYGPPKEQLTDNGRQYATWRGKTKFQMELQKEKIQHIRSSPHHPMTLGKIERFWKTIWDEFLCRAQFDTFEAAHERVKFWQKYYNHMRPNQGIDGLYPADRFFEIRNDVKKMIEKGVEENVLELALRGKPKEPFYMVGRMGQKSVMIHAENGEIRMTLDGKASERGITYEIGAENENNGKEGQKTIQCAGEMSGRLIALGAEQKASSDNEGARSQLDTPEQLAGHGNEGYVADIYAQDGREEAGTASESSEITGETVNKADCKADKDGEAAPENPGDGGQTAKGVNESGGQSQTESGNNNQGSQRADNSNCWGGSNGPEPSALLQVGVPGVGGDDGRPSRPKFRSARLGGGRGEGDAENGIESEG